MLLPLVVLAGVAVLSLNRTLTGFSQASGEAVNEAIPLAEFEADLLQVQGLAYDAVLDDQQRGARPRYLAAAAGIDRGFRELRTRAPLTEEASDLIGAERNWQRAQRVVQRVLALPPQVPRQARAEQMQPFSEYLQAAAGDLHHAHEVAAGDVRRLLGDAQAVQRRFLLVECLVFVAGAVIAVVAGRQLVRSVLVPLSRLRRGTRELARGELSHRVALDRDDELGELAQAFDTMAEELERGRHELAYRALHDPLTGLGNRTLLMDRIEHALASAHRRGQPIALLLIDLDDFKNVNDSLGHLAGDQILVMAAKRITAALRVGDTAARIGGDEFAVLLEDLDDAAAAQLIADRVTTGLRGAVAVQGTEVFLDASVGIALAGGGEDPEALLRNADLAMYRAKQDGKGQAVVFHAGMHTAMVERVGLEAELRRALSSGELTVHYQSVVELDGGRIVGAEALVRWAHPQRGLIPPAGFIPMAEDTGLVVPLGWQVLQQACSQVRAWQDRHAGIGSFTLSVNLSGRQLQHPDLIGQVAEALRQSGLDGSCLVLEITESVMMHEPEAILVRLRQLNELGVRLAVDDFGTGYSSLAYLQRFPIDILKVDKSFVDGLGVDPDAIVLPEAIVGLARSLRLATVAEGIEHAHQAEALQALGCQYGQGYHYARPVDAQRFEQQLMAQQRLVGVGTGPSSWR